MRRDLLLAGGVVVGSLASPEIAQSQTLWCNIIYGCHYAGKVFFDASPTGGEVLHDWIVVGTITTGGLIVSGQIIADSFLATGTTNGFNAPNALGLGINAPNAATNNLGGALNVGSALNVNSGAIIVNGSEVVANTPSFVVNATSLGVEINGPVGEIFMGTGTNTLGSSWAVDYIAAGTLAIGASGDIDALGTGLGVNSGTLYADNQSTISATTTAVVNPTAGTKSYLINMGTTNVTITTGTCYAGEEFRLDIKQGTTPHTVTLGSGIALGLDITSFTATATANARDLLQMICLDGTHSALAAVNHGFPF